MSASSRLRSKWACCGPKLRFGAVRRSGERQHLGQQKPREQRCWRAGMGRVIGCRHSRLWIRGRLRQGNWPARRLNAEQQRALMYLKRRLRDLRCYQLRPPPPKSGSATGSPATGPRESQGRSNLVSSASATTATLFCSLNYRFNSIGSGRQFSCRSCGNFL